MDNKLQAILGTWRTKFKCNEGETETEPLPLMWIEDPFAIVTLPFSRHGL